MCVACPRGAYDIGEFVARLERADFGGRDAYFLHYKSDSAALNVGIGYRERYALSSVACTHYYEMARTTCKRDHWASTTSLTTCSEKCSFG